MSDMVNKVARALCRYDGRDPDAASYLIPGKEMTADGSGNAYAEYLGRARAAITAMREPTEEMEWKGIEAEILARALAINSEDKTHTYSPEFHALRASWRAMIDEATK